MSFYDQNPGVQNEFAQAGAMHDGGGSAPATTPSAAVPTAGQNAQLSAQEGLPTGPGAFNGGTSSGIQQNDPATDPFFKAAAGGMAPGDMAMMGYDEGGAVGEDETDPSAGGENDLSAALQAVEAAFAFGKHKHGLGGQQQASAIPMAPGNQSNSGAPRPLPMPGPLPPTSNPFGKRPTPPTPGRLAEVVPYPSPGGPGPTTAATPYYMGTKKDPKVAPMPVKTSAAGAIPEEEDAA